VDQKFFKKKLGLSATVKKNDFSNPYIPVAFRSNTVYKGLNVNFRSKHLPIITISYAPVSQLTYIDSLLSENIFYSFNSSVTHMYKLGDKQATTSIVYSRFYNNASDSSFTYYNAKNVYYTQSIAFDYYTLVLGISHSKSQEFELNVFDGFFNFKVRKNGSVGLGFKISDFNKLYSRLGPYGSVKFALGRLGIVSLSYDNGFIPTRNHTFIANTMMNVGFLKQL
jgi:hypothetical protein